MNYSEDTCQSSPRNKIPAFITAHSLVSRLKLILNEDKTNCLLLTNC